MLVPHGALVMVADGAQLRLLRNRGRGAEPDLETVPREYLRRDRHARRTDMRVEAHDAFMAVAPLLNGGTPLILIAPADVLGALRAEVPPRAQRHVVAEIARDMTACPTAELAMRLQAAHG